LEFWKAVEIFELKYDDGWLKSKESNFEGRALEVVDDLCFFLVGFEKKIFRGEVKKL
jgi:hypothetical protein